MTAVEQAEAVRRRVISPAELVGALLDRIDRLNPRINAFTSVLADEALAAAHIAAEEVVRSEPDALGRLHGVPFTIKDMTPTAGVRTSFGSRAWANFVPTESAPIYERLLSAGGILLGKTTTPEFAWLAVTESPLTGTTNNPWKLTHTAGGSSGGAAASVAAGMGSIATGTDGGGSIRVPASCCGVVGLKPSLGRVPIFQEDKVFETTLHSGPIARTVRDAALVLTAVAGPDERDPFSIPESGVDFVARLGEGGIGGIRIGYSPNLGIAPVEPQVLDAVEQALQVFDRELGAVVEEISPEVIDPRPMMATIWSPVASLIVHELIVPHVDRAEASQVLSELAEVGTDVSAVDFYRASVMTRSDLYQQIAELLAVYDLLVTPTLPCRPFPHTHGEGGPSSVADVPVREWLDRWIAWLFLTSPFNFTGHPAISVPCGFSDGLPIGLQIIGRRHGDASVLDAAAAYEAAAPWSDRRPPAT